MCFKTTMMMMMRTTIITTATTTTMFMKKQKEMQMDLPKMCRIMEIRKGIEGQVVSCEIVYLNRTRISEFRCHSTVRK